MSISLDITSCILTFFHITIITIIVFSYRERMRTIEISLEFPYQFSFESCPKPAGFEYGHLRPPTYPLLVNLSQGTSEKLEN